MWFKSDKGIFLLYAFGIIVLTLISYQHLSQLFYMNDEWIALGNVLVNGIYANFSQYSILENLLGKGRPLTFLLSNLFYQYFTYNVTPFVVVAYTFHILNGLLLYILVKKISKNRFVSAIAGIFFITASVANQSMTWIPNITQDLTAVTFILVAQLLLLIFSETKKKIYLFLSFFAAYIAFLFKDQFFYIFLWLPILYILLSKTRLSLQVLFKKYWPLFVLAATVIIYKLIVLYGPDIISFKSNAINYWIKAFFNMLYYPLITLSQSFIPPEYMFKSAVKFLYFFYGHLTPYISNIDVISQNIISDILSILLSLLILITLLISYVTNKPQRKTLLIGMLFYVLSFSTVAIYLDTRATSYVESRYLYASMIGIGIFFAVILDTTKRILFKIKLPRIISIFVVSMIAIVYFGKHVTLIQRAVWRSTINAQNETQVLKEFSKILPTLPPKSVIYLSGNNTYYGYANHPVPFQLNPGYILMVWYYKSGFIPDDSLHVNRKLWTFGTQWYEESDGKAFGYYWDLKELQKVIDKKDIDTSQISGLYYDGNTRKLNNITDQVLLELNTQ